MSRGTKRGQSHVSFAGEPFYEHELNGGGGIRENQSGRQFFNNNNRGGGRGGSRRNLQQQQQPRLCYLNADFINQQLHIQQPSAAANNFNRRGNMGHDWSSLGFRGQRVTNDLVDAEDVDIIQDRSSSRERELREQIEYQRHDPKITRRVESPEFEDLDTLRRSGKRRKREHESSKRYSGPKSKKSKRYHSDRKSHSSRRQKNSPTYSYSTSEDDEEDLRVTVLRRKARLQNLRPEPGEIIESDEDIPKSRLQRSKSISKKGKVSKSDLGGHQHQAQALSTQTTTTSSESHHDRQQSPISMNIIAEVDVDVIDNQEDSCDVGSLPSTLRAIVDSQSESNLSSSNDNSQDEEPLSQISQGDLSFVSLRTVISNKNSDPASLNIEVLLPNQCQKQSEKPEKSLGSPPKESPENKECFPPAVVPRTEARSPLAASTASPHSITNHVVVADQPVVSILQPASCTSVLGSTTDQVLKSKEQSTLTDRPASGSSDKRPSPKGQSQGNSSGKPSKKSTEQLESEISALKGIQERLTKELRCAKQYSKDQDMVITDLNKQLKLSEEKDGKIKALRGKKTEVQNELEACKQRLVAMEKLHKDTESKLESAEQELKARDDLLHQEETLSAQNDANENESVNTSTTGHKAMGNEDQLIIAMAYQDRLFLEVEKMRTVYEAEIFKLHQFYESCLANQRNQSMSGPVFGFPANAFPKGCVVGPPIPVSVNHHTDHQQGNGQPQQQQQGIMKSRIGCFAHLGPPDSVVPPIINLNTTSTSSNARSTPRVPLYINQVVRRVQQQNMDVEVPSPTVPSIGQLHLRQQQQQNSNGQRNVN